MTLFISQMDSAVMVWAYQKVVSFGLVCASHFFMLFRVETG